MIDSIVPILAAAIAAGTPLVFAAMGELVVERAGVLNLGVEGMMLVGAIAGFSTGAEPCASDLPYTFPAPIPAPAIRAV